MPVLPSYKAQTTSTENTGWGLTGSPAEPTGTLLETTLERRGAGGLDIALTSPEKSEATRVLRRQLRPCRCCRCQSCRDRRRQRREPGENLEDTTVEIARAEGAQAPKKTDQCEGDRVEDLHSLSLDSKAAPLARIITPI